MHHANSFLPSAHEIHHKVPASHLGHQKDFRTAMGSGIAIASRRIFNILPIRYTSGPQHVRTQEQIMLLSSHLGTAPCSGCHGRFFSSVSCSRSFHEWNRRVACSVCATCIMRTRSCHQPTKSTTRCQPAIWGTKRLSYCNGPSYSNRLEEHLQHIGIDSIYQWPTTFQNTRARSCFCHATSAPHLVGAPTAMEKIAMAMGRTACTATHRS